MVMLRVIAVAFVMSLLMIQVSWGETAYDRQGDVIRPGSELSEGVLDRIIVDENGVESIIINDIVYNVDDDTKVTTASGRSTNLSNFEPGTNLDFYALAGLLTKVMPSLDTEEEGSNNDPVINTPTSGSNADAVHLEDGVWKN